MKKQVGFRLSEISLERLDILSARLEMNRTDVIEHLLTTYEDNETKSDTVSDEVVSSLLRQMEEKDKQIGMKDEQINQLMEQCRNFQVLLKVEHDKQVLLLTPKKVSWIRSLFGSRDQSTDQ